MKSEKKPLSSTLADEQIVELYWRREEDAIRETDLKYGKLLYRIANNILRNVADSEECQNDVYLRTWNSIPPQKPLCLPAFLSELTRHLALNKYRDATVKKRIPSELTTSIDEIGNYLQAAETPEENFMNKELGRLVNEYVKTLSKQQRYIFFGRFCLADTLETIADELGINVSSVQRTVERIKKGLKKYLEGNGYYV